MKRIVYLCAAALIVVPVVASAQAPSPSLQTPAAPPAEAGHEPPAPASDQDVTFSADTVDYDHDNDLVTARGDVRMLHQGSRLRADTVVWNRATGDVTATGSVVITNPQGDRAFGDKATLDSSLKNGVVENMLLVLEDGGRLAAVHGVRRDGVTTLTRAAYTPCRVVGDNNCPRRPVWEITAVQVVDDPVRHRLYYKDAHFIFLGKTLLWLPALSHPDGSGEGGDDGLLVPSIGYMKRNGVDVSTPYYFRLAPNRDLTVTPTVFSSVLPMIRATYRDLTPLGAFQADGYVTYGTRLPASTDPVLASEDYEQHGIRGYLGINGNFQLDPYWSLSVSSRITSDKTFLRRYDINGDDRLRSNVDVERIDGDSDLSIEGWALQDLRVTADPGQQPIALPVIDYRRELRDPWLGGRVELEANTLGIVRTSGQDTQRAFASAKWELSRITPLGQELTLTGLVRGDVYHSDDNELTPVPLYAGDAGWETRGIAAVAADMRWPFVGPAFGGTQQITPHIQLVASPHTKNLSIPDEDSRSVDLTDSNLFSLNRFPGYDRWEDGERVTYGGEYRLDVPGLSVIAVIGQSYRLDDEPSVFPDGTGLSDRFSDVVGRTTLQWGRFVELSHQYRLDKDNLAIRRNELDLTLGSSTTYFTLDYLKLNRDIDLALEDLRDREELRAGGRIQLAKHWSIYGSTVIDLTGPKEDPTVTGDGFSPVRHRLGIDYSDECFELGVTLRRDYDVVGDAARGTSVLFRLAFKNLGR